MSPTTRSPARIDRRLDERQDCMTGLLRWLESARRLLALDALALADDSGCLVVGAGSAQRCEELAAIAPLAGKRRIASAFLVDELPTGSAWLCAPDRAVPPERWREVIGGCSRILGWDAS